MIQSQFVNKQKGFRTVTVQFSFLMFAGFHNQYPLLTMVNLKQQFRDVCCQQHAYGSSTELLWGGPLVACVAGAKRGGGGGEGEREKGRERLL